MEVKKSRLIVLSALMIVAISLMAYFVIGKLDQGGAAVGSAAVAPFRWANISRSNVNFTFVVNESWPEGGAGSGMNMNVTNITVMWQLIINNSIMANITIFNGTSRTHNSTFNRTFDSTTIPDGIYNLTIIFYNMSVGSDAPAGVAGGKRINVSFNQTFIVVDNTAPNVTLYQNQSNFDNLTVASNNITLINFSVVDTIPGLAINTTRVRTVILEFDNATAESFNVSVFSSAELGANGSSPDTLGLSDSQSGVMWVRYTINTTGGGDILNLSHLHAGYHTIRIYVNDSANNSNNTVTETFILNSAPNVTWVGMSILNQTNTGGANMSLVGLSQISGPTFGQNFSGKNGTFIVFNFSVQNRSIYNSTVASNLAMGMLGVVNESATMILMFDNATGNDFNITAGRTSVISASYVVAHSYNASYNVSLLVEGNHTVTVWANDSRGNWNHTEKIVFMVDNTEPTISITCDTGKTIGQKVSCTCTASDALSGVDDLGPVFAGSLSASEETTAGTAGSFTTSACLATDGVGNAATKTSTYSVTTASSGGTGSSGSGGGSSTGVVGNYERKIWTSINSGETATVTPKSNGMAITKVEFTATETIHGAWVKVAKVVRKDLPAEAAAKVTGKVHEFIEITKNELSVKDAALSDVKIDFKVEKKWLTDNSVDKNDVVLLRYLDDSKKWTELSATVTEEDVTYVRYSAATPGFSYFAVAEKGAAEEAEVVTVTPTTPATDTTTGTPTGTDGTTGGGAAGTTPAEGTGFGTVLLWVVVVLAVLAGAVWLVKRRR